MNMDQDNILEMYHMVTKMLPVISINLIIRVSLT